MNLTVTDLAQQRLTTLLADRETNPKQAIRIFAQAGGCACSGPQFGMGLDEASGEDQVVQIGTLMFVVDPHSAPVLEGASIDYVDDVMRSGFAIEAPNAEATGGSCGCGGH
jgi:iron-sulfur cluster assembly accessory protein